MKKDKKTFYNLNIKKLFYYRCCCFNSYRLYIIFSKILIGLSSKLIPQNINPNNYLPYSIPGIEIIISVILITIVGGLSLSFLGKRILKLIDDLFKRIPF